MIFSIPGVGVLLIWVPAASLKMINSITLLIVTFWSLSEATVRSPIVIVPGDGGSQLWVKLDYPSDAKLPHFYCDKKTKDFVPVWVDVERLLPGTTQDCTLHNLKLVYNQTTRKCSDIPGVQSMVPGLGDTKSVEYVSTDSDLFPYFKALVEQAKQWGYVSGLNIRAAPFDWRYGPNQLTEYFANLTLLIEDTFAINQNKPVTILSHSLGCMMTHYLLSHKTQAWKDKFIRRYISIAGPYGGTMTALLATLSGYDFGVNPMIFDPLKFRALEDTLPSSTFMFPSPKFWNTTELIVKSPDRNYTVKDYNELLADANDPIAVMMFEDTAGLIDGTAPPGVEVQCIIGTGVKTVEQLIFAKGKFPNVPKKVHGDGDGTVNERSLRACYGWIGKQKQRINIQTFSGITHFDLVSNSQVIDVIKQIVMNP